VGAGSDQLSEREQRTPQRKVRFYEASRVVLAFGQVQQLLCKCVRRPDLRPYVIKAPQSPQYWEELRRLPALLAEFPRPGIGPLDFRGSIPLGGYQHRPQGRLQAEFLPDEFRRGLQGLEQLDPFREVVACFTIG